MRPSCQPYVPTYNDVLDTCPMPHRQAHRPVVSVLRISVLVVAIALLASPRAMLAQRGGGGGRGLGGGSGAGAGRPAGVSEKDDLKDFHRALAVQASAEQIAAFAKVVHFAQAASDRLQSFRNSLPPVGAPSSPADLAATVHDSVEEARSSNQNFLASFSSAQKSGLKDLLKKLEKTDSDLDKHLKTLVQIAQSPKPASDPISSSAARLGEALASFQNEQFALAQAMGIVLPSASQNLTYKLPQVTTSIDIAGQPVSISTSGAVSRTSAENGRNVFTLELTADLSALQQNVTAFFRSELTRSPRCGERLDVTQASLAPLAPASLVVLNLRYERWICPAGQAPLEAAAGDGVFEVKLTPAIEAPSGLRLGSEITRVEGDPFLRDLLRSGDFGAALRDQIAASLLSALQKSARLQSSLPPVARESAILQKTQFQDAGADQLTLVLSGQVDLSDEQASQFAAQLKQSLDAQQSPAP